MRRAPLRFLVIAVGLWLCARVAILAPGRWPEREQPPRSVIGRSAATAVATPISAPTANSKAAASPSNRPSPRRHLPDPGPILVASATGLNPAGAAPPWLPTEARLQPSSDDRPGPARAAGAPGRWSASAWLLVRHEPGGAALSPGGTLGGSQAGARLSYRLGGGLALSGRVSLPLRSIAGAEAAAGLDWRPAASIPLHILAERRQALGGGGRSAFALAVYGGGGRALPRGLRLDAYGQAGIVGARRRDLFVDGAIRIAAPVGPVEVGVGARGAAQPGAARLDAGPGLAWRLPLRGANVRIEADWRFRVAGAAAPGSGPALTLATDF
jgi:hypothetical protein